MKQVSVTVFGRNLNKHLSRIPEEGFLLVNRKVPVAVVKKPNEKRLKEDIRARAKEAVRMVKIDTFTEKRVGEIEETMGMCSRCGTQGKVVRKMYVNEHGTYMGKWLCVANCFNNDQKPRSRVRVMAREVRGENGDFGRANENTF